MSKYILRLDDACEKRDIERWNKLEALLDEYEIKPIVGVIPHCEDPKFDGYPVDTGFWKRVHAWKEKGWSIAMHGYNHVYSTICGGINPVNFKSEFAGEPYEVQVEKIRRGVEIFRMHQIEPGIFFAPSHTFDENTIRAIKQESSIRIISDTIANDVYQKYGLTFVPQQSGRVRKLPFKVVTFCYHPNQMQELDFIHLEQFLQGNKEYFDDFKKVSNRERKETLLDCLLKQLYFIRRK